MLREILTREFEKRRLRRPNYSKRGFANSLGLSPSFVSKIINGKTGASQQTIAKIIAKLNLLPDELLKLPAHFIKTPKMTQTKSLTFSMSAVYAAISSKDGMEKSELTKLLVPQDQINSAIEILLRDDLIQEEAGRYYTTANGLLNRNLSDNERESFHQDTYKFWQQAFDQDPSQTLNSNLLVCCSRASKELVFLEILEFQKRINSILKNDVGDQKVYSLCANMFPVSRELNPKN